jgi:hypothetical protein
MVEELAVSRVLVILLKILNLSNKDLVFNWRRPWTFVRAY